MAMHWFKLYGTDYLGDPDVRELSMAERGALVSLWAACCARGGSLPDDIQRVSRMSDVPVEDCETLVPRFFDLVVESWEPKARLIPERSGAPKVYVIADSVRGLLKIGTSKTVNRRLTTLRREHGGHLILLGSFPGSFREEKDAHRAFADLHAHGEWFQDHSRIRQWLRDEQKGGR